MIIHVQPHPVLADGRSGLCTSFLSELPPRQAILEWCRQKKANGGGRVGGWFRLEQISDYFHGAALWQAVWPMTDKVYRFVVTKS